MRAFFALSFFVLFSASSLAQEATPEGVWRDEYGTTLKISLCGDGTQLCAVLVDVQGKSRTDANLAYVNQQVVQAAMTAPNEWQGTVVFDGSEAHGTITQVTADTIEIEGCRAAILCQTLAFNRV
jgi:hypothetical protein